MRGRAVLVASLVANVALGAFCAWRLMPSATPVVAPTLAKTNAAAPAPIVRTNVVVRRQNFTWQELESADYRVFISNLRAIHCPEQTLRDIVISEINQLYAHKRATNVTTPDQLWWQSDPDPQVMQAAYAQMNALDDERRQLLTQLLGPGWEKGSPVLAGFGGIHLSGSVLGTLSAEAKQAVQDANERGTQRLQAYLQERQKNGQPTDPAELARIRQGIRQDLAKVLSPAELEEYLLRYSQTAINLRNEMRGFDLSQEEFRTLFRAYDEIDQRGLTEGVAAGGRTAATQAELERQKQAAMEAALSPERQKLYQLNQDPVFRQARTTVQQFGAPAEAVMPLFEIGQATAAEQTRIKSDASLSPEEREEALAATVAAQRNSMRQVLGDEAYQRYLANLEAKERFLQNRPIGN